jgi:hypothetical protein
MACHVYAYEVNSLRSSLLNKSLQSQLILAPSIQRELTVILAGTAPVTVSIFSPFL